MSSRLAGRAPGLPVSEVLFCRTSPLGPGVPEPELLLVVERLRVGAPPALPRASPAGLRGRKHRNEPRPGVTLGLCWASWRGAQGRALLPDHSDGTGTQGSLTVQGHPHITESPITRPVGGQGGTYLGGALSGRDGTYLGRTCGQAEPVDGRGL